MSIFVPCTNGDLRPEKRSGHVSVFYQGLFIVFGGYGDWEEREDAFLPYKHLWCYNVEASQWTRYTTKGDYPGNATGSCVTLVGSKMYLLGGFYQQEGQTDKLYLFDLKTFTWHDLTHKVEGSKPSSRDKFGCWTSKDKIIYFGGFGPPPENVSTVIGEFYFEEFPHVWSRGFGWNNHLYVLNVSENLLKWSQPSISGNIPCPRAAFTTAQLGNKGFLFGGRFKDERRNDMYCLDLNTFIWSEIRTPSIAPCGRSWHVMTPLSDNHLFMYGGFDNVGESLKDTWIYNVRQNSWLELENASSHLGQFSRRMWHTASHTDIPGEVLIFGGCTNSIVGTERAVHTNILTVFRFSPLPLQQLCLDYIMLNVGKYYPFVDDLPRSLQWSISQRCHALGLSNSNGHGKLVNRCKLM